MIYFNLYRTESGKFYCGGQYDSRANAAKFSASGRDFVKVIEVDETPDPFSHLTNAERESLAASWNPPGRYQGD